jgi:hypothetical protein
MVRIAVHDADGGQQVLDTAPSPRARIHEEIFQFAESKDLTWEEKVKVSRHLMENWGIDPSSATSTQQPMARSMSFSRKRLAEAKEADLKLMTQLPSQTAERIDRAGMDIFVASYNVNGEIPRQDEADLWLRQARDSDLVLVGFQEGSVRPINSFPTCKSYSHHEGRPIELCRGVMDEQGDRQFVNTIQAALGDSFVLIADVALGEPPNFRQKKPKPKVQVSCV